MIDFPLPIPLPTHSRTKLTSDMIAQFGMVAADRISGADAAPQSHASPSQRIAVHPERRVSEASQRLSLACLLIGDVVAIAREKLRNSDCIERSYVVGDQSPI
ncbi:hypothetical protein BSZ19_49140 [Bradyrhizobium japonicum]|uniref:Uncharacterized protein n=1 Tax=Bradyrhizobium japonicum TaxID=375 RepID=A0A1Y2J7X6_BRAJP|nr:hypothetical protein BSZ19_49140 [Bradyrhizobium japonicum]